MTLTHGTFHITEMELWDDDYLNEAVQAFMYFGADRLGEFQFGYVRGGLDYRQVEREGKPAVEFSWIGEDGRHPRTGRGWAVLEGDELKGRFFFHQGDDSAFTARRAGQADE